MSSTYSLEPPTRGKVTVKTTLGDLDVELWSKEAPKACRNFVQLCLEGYYNKTNFHRVIKDFMVQGGDPTGSGTGGESIYGGPFEDEFHSRLQFRRRALVACANEANKPNSNRSQFFITLARSDWLTKKNTIFGTVTGDTVYNLMKFNDLEVDSEDKPIDPPHVISTEVAWNPFDDMVPRVGQESSKGSDSNKIRNNRGRVRNKNLLSFGDEEGEEGDTSFDFKSSKKIKAPLERPKESTSGRKDEVAVAAAAGEQETARGESKVDTSSLGLEQRMMDRVKELRREMNDPAKVENPGRDDRKSGADAKEVKQAKPSLKKALKMKVAKIQDSDLHTESEARRRALKRKRKLTASREKDTLARLQTFQSHLFGGKGKSNNEGEAKSVDVSKEKQSMPAAWRVDQYLDDDVDDDIDMNSLRSHSLVCAKAKKDNSTMRRDSVDDYVVLDPLLENGKKKWNKKKQMEQKRAHRWQGK